MRTQHLCAAALALAWLAWASAPISRLGAAADQPASGPAPAGQLAAGQAAPEQPAAGQSASDQPAIQETAADQAATAPPAAPPAAEARPVIDVARYDSLQAALDAVPDGGALVRLPPGRFVIQSPLTLSRQNTRVEGAGQATQIVNLNQQGQPALIVRPPERTGDAPARSGCIWRIELANFCLTGNPQSGPGLLASGVNELYLEGLAVDHHGGHGIELIDCYEDPRVASCIITYNRGSGLRIQAGHDIVVCANQFEENHDAVFIADSFNLCMTGNNLDDHLGNGVVIENTYGSVVSGNMIEECAGTAIVLDRDCYGITLSANVLAHNRAGGVWVRDGWGCAVSGNTFTINATRGVEVGPDAGRITISANNFSNAQIGGQTKRDDAATGVILRGTRDVLVSGNVFSGLQHAAVQADAACQRISVTGNLMVELHLGGGSGPAVDLGGAQQCLVEGNLSCGPREQTPSPPALEPR